MTEEKKNRAYSERQIVIFGIGPEEFGVDISEVREIIKLEEVTRLPDTEEYIDGVINLRGKIIVVVDLSKKLGLKAKDRGKDTRIIVIEIGSNLVGMVVDCCNEVMRLPSDKIEPAPEMVSRKINSAYLEGVGILGERLIILLDLASVLDKKSIEQAAEKHIQS